MALVKDKYFRVLEHGFVALKDSMGDDYSIERAARVSCGKGTRPVSKTEGLINHLLSSDPPHMAPTEAVYVEFHIRAPLFIQTQMLRYRWASPNVYSGRYSKMLELFHIPEKFMFQSKDNKQGATEQIDEEANERFRADWEHIIKDSLNRYHEALDAGIAREQARGILPYNIYSDMYWRVHLRNLFHFLEERVHPGAQPEIQAYAEIIGGIAKEIAPIAFAKWQDNQFEAVTLNKQEFNAILNYKTFPHDRYTTTKAFEDEYLKGMGNRQIKEFWHKIEKAQAQSHNFNLPWDRVIEVIDAEECEL